MASDRDGIRSTDAALLDPQAVLDVRVGIDVLHDRDGETGLGPSITGWLDAPSGPQPFSGWIDLVVQLEGLCRDGLVPGTGEAGVAG